MLVPGELRADPRRGRARLDVTTAVLAAVAIGITIALIGLPGRDKPGKAPAADRAIEARSGGTAGAGGAGGAGDPPTPTPEARSTPPADAERAVEDVLTPPAGGPKPEIDKMAASIAAFGDKALPIVIAILCGEAEVPEVALGKPGQPVHEFAIEHQQEILIASLKRFRRAEVLQQLRVKGTGNAPLENRLVVVHLLGELQSAAALEVMLAVTAGIEPIHLERKYVQNTLEQAVASCVTADPTSFGMLEHAKRELPAALLPVVARGLGRTRSELGARFLAQLLGQNPALDEIVLGELARVTEANGIVLPENALQEIRRLLDHPAPEIQRTAAAVLGRLRDRNSFDAIAGKLGSTDRAVAASAAWSLAHMSQMKLGSDPERWIEWHEQQETWWTDEAPALLADLRGSDNSRMVGAFTELLQRPFFAHEISEVMAPLALSTDSGLALMAISAVQDLGSSRAVPMLVQALAIDDSRRAPAVRALRALTGVDLPGEFAAWSAVFPVGDARER